MIARLVPENGRPAVEMPDFLGRMRAIYGDKVFKVSGAELIAKAGAGIDLRSFQFPGFTVQSRCKLGRGCACYARSNAPYRGQCIS